jgi:hypothetical protein
MKVYIQSTKNRRPHNYNFANAYQGFYEMGFEIIPFHTYQELAESKPEDVVAKYPFNDSY